MQRQRDNFFLWSLMSVGKIIKILNSPDIKSLTIYAIIFNIIFQDQIKRCASSVQMSILRSLRFPNLTPLWLYNLLANFMTQNPLKHSKCWRYFTLLNVLFYVLGLVLTTLYALSYCIFSVVRHYSILHFQIQWSGWRIYVIFIV